MDITTTPTLLVRLAVAAALLSPTPGSAQAARVTESVQVVERFVEAFNAHDVGAMTALVTDDVELRYADEDGGFALASSTADQLGDDMREYFQAYPDVRSRVEGIVGGPAFVSFRERIVGGQSSIAVYEVRDGRIRRVWYYPAEDPAQESA